MNNKFSVALTHEATQQIMELTEAKRAAIYKALWRVCADPYFNVQLKDDMYAVNLEGYRVDYVVKPDERPPTIVVVLIKKLRG